MEGRWDLSSLYRGFDDPAFEQDIRRLDEMMDAYICQVAQLREKGEGLTAQSLSSLMEQEEAMWVVGADLHKFTSMTQEADAGDGRAANAMGRLKKLYGKIAGATAQVRRWISQLELTDEDYSQYPTLADYRFYLAEAKEQGKHLLSTETEEVVARMQPCAGGAWVDMRNYLTSYAQVPFRGEEKTLTQLRSLARSQDQETRKAAYEAELACSKAIAGGMSFALNGIKEQVTLLSDLRGYPSVMDLTMVQCRMQRKTLDAMLEAIVEALPKFHGYLRRKAELLGYTNGLPWYEMLTGMGKYDHAFDQEAAHQFLVERLGAFAEDLGQLVDRAFREHWIDFYPRPGKTGGAFCRNLSNQKESRVLTNFDGTLDGVVTIAHELGHAYHGHQIEDHRPLNRTYTMPVAETASNFNETLVMSSVLAQAEGEEKLALLEQRIQDFTQTICDIYSRYLFEQSVFAGRREGFLFPEQLCQMMEEAQKKAYGDGLDHDYLHPYMWVNKVHYYMTNLSFYNFPYAFGALLANGLYVRYQEEGPTFVEKYRKMLHATTVCTVEDAASVAGIDVTDPGFWRESLSVVVALIDQFMEMTAEMGRNK